MLRFAQHDNKGASTGLIFAAASVVDHLVEIGEANFIDDRDAPGFRLHPLKGDRVGQWSVRVSGNWRVVFRFEDGEAVDVDLIDYH